MILVFGLFYKPVHCSFFLFVTDPNFSSQYGAVNQGSRSWEAGNGAQYSLSPSYMPYHVPPYLQPANKPFISQGTSKETGGRFKRKWTLVCDSAFLFSLRVFSVDLCCVHLSVIYFKYFGRLRMEIDALVFDSRSQMLCLNSQTVFFKLFSAFLAGSVVANQHYPLIQHNRHGNMNFIQQKKWIDTLLFKPMPKVLIEKNNFASFGFETF